MTDIGRKPAGTGPLVAADGVAPVVGLTAGAGGLDVGAVALDGGPDCVEDEATPDATAAELTADEELTCAAAR